MEEGSDRAARVRRSENYCTMNMDGPSQYKKMCVIMCRFSRMDLTKPCAIWSDSTILLDALSSEAKANESMLQAS
jgi:hypothetical protein